MKKFFRILLVAIPLLVVAIYFLSINSNNYQTDGSLRLQGLKEQVKVVRDEKGMPYIHAKNIEDLLMAQGYVMAQDRLFQMQLTRLFAEGRIAELAGEKAIGLDTRMRTYGFYRNAIKHVPLLSEEQTQQWQAFANGINAYIQHGEDQHVEFALAGISPDLWEVEHCLAVLYYMGWGGAGNLSSEALSQMMIDKIGTEKFLSLLPLFTNPDDAVGPMPDTAALAGLSAVEASTLAALTDKSDFQILWGSNNWAADGTRSSSGKPILASDPHLDARILPGTMYPCGLFLDDMRAVGVTIPGMPGLIIGRNQYIANGITNAYLDQQDLFIEQVDPNNPNNYLEGEQSIPFEVIEETLYIKDGEAEGGKRSEKVTIKLTKRGPIVSDVIPGLQTQRVLSLRWAAYENMKSELGLNHLLKAKSIKEARAILEGATMACNNIVLVDIHGEIAWQTVGSIPYRANKAGRFPHLVTDSIDTWLGIVPYDSMPHQVGAERGWIGNANHNTIKHDFPYYVSNNFAPKYRYARLKELMDSKEKFSSEDFWDFQRDHYNILAASFAPKYAEILSQQPETAELGQQLASWDYNETLTSVPTTIYHSMYRKLAYLTFHDELGDELAMSYLKSWYFWQERFEKMVNDGQSPWFDDVTTSDVTESYDDLIRKAGLEVKEELTALLGKDISAWQWEKVHQIEFVNPLVREGAAKGLVGAVKFPMAGSGETLYRAKYAFDKPFDIVFHSALRMVADMADPEKVLAVVSGGAVGRTFSPHLNDQLEAYANGQHTYWWFSPEQIEKHQVEELILEP